jgi:putative tryptophan/tyrosine transport system substrate-binding protein
MFRNQLSIGKTHIGWTVLSIFVIVSMILSGCGSQKPKVYHVGVLSGLDFVADITDGFKAKMTELGYVEGTNIVYDVQKTNFDMEAYKKILKKFVDDKVDVIVCFPTEATMEAKNATKGTDIPVVFTFAFVEGMGIIDSIQAPGGNITGVRYPGPDVVLKRFEILHELAPNAKRIYVPYQKGYPIVNPQLEALRPVMKEAGLTLIEGPATDVASLEADIKSHASGNDPGIDAILLPVEPLTVVPDVFMVLGKFAYENKIPLGGAYMQVGDYRSIFGVNVNNVEVGKQTAPLVDKVLKGTKAGTIPVVSSESFLQIDLQAAQALGVTVPEGLLKQANLITR